MENSKEQILVDQSKLLEINDRMIALLPGFLIPSINIVSEKMLDEAPEFSIEQLELFKETNERAINRMNRSPLCNYLAGEKNGALL